MVAGLFFLLSTMITGISSECELEGLQKTLIRIARLRLNAKQRKTLAFLGGDGGYKNATCGVREISLHLGCSDSTVWNVLRMLKRLQLVDFGNAESKGMQLRLTSSGRFVAGGVQND